jgi:hypothetical protein
LQCAPLGGRIVGVATDFGNQPGDFSTAAQMTAPSGRMVS